MPKLLLNVCFLTLIVSLIVSIIAEPFEDDEDYLHKYYVIER